MNKFFLAFASLFTSGIFAYSYLKEWLSVKLWDKELVLEASADIVYPYFHQSKDLYLRIIFLFGTVFLLLFIASFLFTVQKKQKSLFFCFVLIMLAVFAVMVNAAIK